MDKMARADGMGVRKSSSTGFTSGLVEFFEVNTIELVLATLRKLDAERSRSIPDIYLLLAFVKSRYLIRGTCFDNTKCLFRERIHKRASQRRKKISEGIRDRHVCFLWC